MFIVDSGKDNGEISFGVRKQIKIEDAALRKENLEDINDRAISKGFISNEISERVGRSSNQHSGSSIGRELQEELSTDTRKSANNESGVSDEARHSRRIINSDGVLLTKEQAEYFKDSKILRGHKKRRVL